METGATVFLFLPMALHPLFNSCSLACALSLEHAPVRKHRRKEGACPRFRSSQRVP